MIDKLLLTVFVSMAIFYPLGFLEIAKIGTWFKKDYGIRWIVFFLWITTIAVLMIIKIWS